MQKCSHALFSSNEKWKKRHPYRFFPAMANAFFPKTKEQNLQPYPFFKYLKCKKNNHTLIAMANAKAADIHFHAKPSTVSLFPIIRSAKQHLYSYFSNKRCKKCGHAPFSSNEKWKKNKKKQPHAYYFLQPRQCKIRKCHTHYANNNKSKNLSHTLFKQQQMQRWTKLYVGSHSCKTWQPSTTL